MRFWLTFVVALGVPAIPCAGQKITKLSEKEILGTWDLVRAESDGKKYKPYITKLVFKKGGRVEIHEESGKGHTVVVTRFRIRKRGDLKELDEGSTTEDGKPILGRLKGGGTAYEPASRGIFKIEKDTLTICWQRVGKRPRPKKFETKKGDRTELLVLKRDKD